jgi:hypothetical protein
MMGGLSFSEMISTTFAALPVGAGSAHSSPKSSEPRMK